MSSTYTTRLKLNLQGTGDNLSTWGNVLNSGVFQLADDSVAGYTTIDVSSVVVTLTTNQGATDQDRMAILQANGTLTSGVAIVYQSVSKVRWIKNTTTGNFTVTAKSLGGSGVVIPQGNVMMVFSDGVSSYPGSVPVSPTGLASPQGIAVSGPAFSGYVTLTDAASIDINMGLGINFVVTLGGNRTLAAPTGNQPGQSGIIVICQDATGSRTLAFNSAWLFAGGTDPTMSTSVSAIDALWYQVYTSAKILAGTANLFS